MEVPCFPKRSMKTWCGVFKLHKSVYGPFFTVSWVVRGPNFIRPLLLFFLNQNNRINRSCEWMIFVWKLCFKRNTINPKVSRKFHTKRLSQPWSNEFLKTVFSPRSENCFLKIHHLKVETFVLCETFVILWGWKYFFKDRVFKQKSLMYSFCLDGDLDWKNSKTVITPLESNRGTRAPGGLGQNQPSPQPELGKW
jgi:hypothetical protein